MARPTSFRLPDDLLERLEEEAAASGTSVTALVTALLDEGMKTHRFPGIVYRDGPTGRRARIVGGPDVWEIIRAVAHAKGRGEARLRAVAKAHDLPLDRARLAVEFYAAFPGEIDERIEADERAAQRIREEITRREQLLSS
ncbi:MAG: ribbon-helix-helix protein, CopG family [Microthrixaceae bacterium]